jgi:alkylhydroperoxidase family enzyme
MAPRIDVTKYPDALKAMYGLERIGRERDIERKLLHLIKTRVSQINGCAYCIDMHTKDACGRARPSSACTACRRGRRRRSTRPASVPRWSGPRR